jgi:dTDP-4-amino-4,6-dideoxygalactose transaminase
MDAARIPKSIPVFKPILPSADVLLPYLRRIDESGWYSNMGPLVRELEVRLGEYFGVPADHVVTCANGTIGLTLALWAVGTRPQRYCAMPSWTFVATAAAATGAGLNPLFLDVDRNNWALDPGRVVDALSDYDIGAVVPVAPFGAPINVVAWDDFHERTGIPVVIDAAAAFDSFRAGRLPASSRSPFMISFHATKSLAMGEGAAIIACDAMLAKEIRKLSNFGFLGSRIATIPGVNAKISEYTAAVGLASLDEWPHRRSMWEQVTASFLSHVGGRSGLRAAPQVASDWVSVYGNVELSEPYDVRSVITALEARGVGARSWWGEGCHRQPAYQSCARRDLANTDYLGRHVIGLPFWLGLDGPMIRSTFDKLAEVLAQS